MSHFTEEELTLHYYRESAHGDDVEAHLAGCDRCRRLYGTVERELSSIGGVEAPDPGAGYARDVWQAIEARLGAAPSTVTAPRSRSWLAPAAAAAMIVVAGGLWLSYRIGFDDGGAAIDEAVRRQALMTAVSMHLESSERLLLELSNLDREPRIDLVGPRKRAASLASTNRLYRRTAELHRESELAGLLDELERVLLDVANAPDEVDPTELNALWSRIERSGLVIRMRLQEAEARAGRAPSEV